MTDVIGKGVWIATKPIELDRKLTVVQVGQARYQHTLPNLITPPLQVEVYHNCLLPYRCKYHLESPH
jgi:hypothetical protein